MISSTFYSKIYFHSNNSLFYNEYAVILIFLCTAVLILFALWSVLETRKNKLPRPKKVKEINKEPVDIFQTRVLMYTDHEDGNKTLSLLKVYVEGCKYISDWSKNYTKRHVGVTIENSPLPVGYHKVGIIHPSNANHSSELCNWEALTSYIMSELVLAPTIPGVNPVTVRASDTNSPTGYAWPGNITVVECKNLEKMVLPADQECKIFDKWNNR